MEIVVGIDVSKERLDVAILPQEEVFAVGNDHAGIDELAERLKGIGVDAIALEATGGFEMLAVAGLSAAGLTVLVVNPAQVRAYAHAIGRRAKTDPIDAAVIAAFVLATKPEIRPLRDAETQALSELVARRRQIVRMVVAEENRLRMALAKQAQKSIKRLLKALRRELESLDADLDSHIRKSPVWRVREALLTSVPGVGATTARTLLAELPELGSLDRRQIASLAGLAPWTRQSGKWKGKSFIGGGQGTRRPIHGRPRRQPIQPRPQGLPRQAGRGRQAQDRRHRRNHAQAAHHPQCHHQGRTTMAKRLTNKTVALPAGEKRESRRRD
ncbi:IS110 family transposase [Rhizobium ruizarguesonis]